MEIFKTERLTDERWLNLFARTYRRGDHEGRWLFASRRPRPETPARGADAVLIVPVLLGDGGPRLVMVREYRIPLGATMLAFPAGLVEEGETPEDVARRELKEETGLEVVAVTRVSPVVYSSAGMTDEAVRMVFVTARATPDGKTALDHSEMIETVLLDYQQVCALCDSDERIDGKAWAILYLYQQLGKLQ